MEVLSKFRVMKKEGGRLQGTNLKYYPQWISQLDVFRLYRGSEKYILRYKNSIINFPMQDNYRNIKPT